MKKLISIVLPIYNEHDNIPVIYQELTSVLSSLSSYSYELIFVNDGSRDASWQKILMLASADVHVKGICFSRNFGHQIALTAGYDKAAGDIIICLDADMQHPPSIIPDMIQKWEQGAHIVYARKLERNDTFLKRVTALAYYRFLDNISDVTIPRNVADFRLIDRKVLNYIQQSKEYARYLRGMIAWTGFSHDFVDFKCQERLNGQTGYTWKKMFKLAFDGITGFSTFPLKIAGYAGVFVILTGMIMFSYITFDALLRHVHYPLFKWLVTIIYIFMGILFVLVWLLGEYIGRIYEQLRGRPLYIIADETNPTLTTSSQQSIHTGQQKEI